MDQEEEEGDGEGAESYVAPLLRFLTKYGINDVAGRGM